jgi:hypothetical protein
MLPFETRPYDAAQKPQNEDNVLWRNGKIEIWTYGLDTRTSKLGVVVVVIGMAVTLAYLVLDILTQVRVKSPTALLAGALVHKPAEDELSEANASEKKAGRIRYASNFLDGGWLKFEKIS